MVNKIHLDANKNFHNLHGRSCCAQTRRSSPTVLQSRAASKNLCLLLPGCILCAVGSQRAIRTSSDVACLLQMAWSGFVPSTSSSLGLVTYAATLLPEISEKEGILWGLCPCTPVNDVAASGILSCLKLAPGASLLPSANVGCKSNFGLTPTQDISISEGPQFGCRTTVLIAAQKAELAAVRH